MSAFNTLELAKSNSVTNLNSSIMAYKAGFPNYSYRVDLSLTSEAEGFQLTLSANVLGRKKTYTEFFQTYPAHLDIEAYAAQNFSKIGLSRFPDELR